MKTPFIVSANYFDRTSPQRWLLRPDQDTPSELNAVYHVLAHNVHFGNSSAMEEGFGCRVVANCESANSYSNEIPDGEFELKFNGHDRFYKAVGSLRKYLNEVKTLRLTKDGKMFATV